jgi:hypothetical protein
MKSDQAISNLEAINTIPVREMSKAMFRMVRASARCAQRAYPGMAGYYDPESVCVRAQPWNFLFPKARYTSTIPQSQKLLGKTAKPTPDFFASLKLLGIL